MSDILCSSGTIIDMKSSAVLVALQSGIPICRRPFAALGDQFGLSEAAVIETIEHLFDSGAARRFGAVFDVRRLGYISSLCALSLTQSEREQLIPRLTPHGGITHCYLRGWPDELDPNLPGGPGGTPAPNVWFTLAALSARFHSELAVVRDILQPHQLLVLPAVRRFKIDVVFDPRTRKRSE